MRRSPDNAGEDEESQHLLGSSPEADTSSGEVQPSTQQPQGPEKARSVLVIPSAASHQPLEASPVEGEAEPSPEGRARSSDSGSTSTTGGSKGKDTEIGQCRICLEEDALSNLEVPCACTGTSKFAHHECIQRWINEKGNLRCEICDQQYRGAYTVPPPGTAGQDEPGNMFSPMFAIRLDPDSLGPGGAHHGAAGDRAALDFLDESDHYYQRNPLASWCFTFVIFIMFLVVLHHTMIVADGMDTGMPGAPPASPSPSPSVSGSTEADEYAASLTLFLFWIGTKAFLIGIPLYTVMRIAARQARREQYEAMLRSGAFDVPTRRVMWRVQLRDQELREQGAAAGGGGGNGAAPTGANAV